MSYNLEWSTYMISIRHRHCFFAVWCKHFSVFSQLAGEFVRSNELQQGDFIVIYSDVKSGKYVMFFLSIFLATYWSSVLIPLKPAWCMIQHNCLACHRFVYVIKWQSSAGASFNLVVHLVLFQQQLITPWKAENISVVYIHSWYRAWR